MCSLSKDVRKKERKGENDDQEEKSRSNEFEKKGEAKEKVNEEFYRMLS